MLAGDVHLDGREHWLSQAQSLQAFELSEGAIEGALKMCFVSQCAIEPFGVGYVVSRIFNLSSKLFKKGPTFFVLLQPVHLLIN